LLGRRCVTPSGCWVLNGGARNESYTGLTIKGVDLRVHQWSAYAWLGHRVRAGRAVVVRHRCDNPPCFNPDHLTTGSYFDNWQDALERGQWQMPTACVNGHEYTAETTYVTPGGVRKCRTCMNATRLRWEGKRPQGPGVARAEVSQRAEDNGNHKLTWEQVRAMRVDRAAGMAMRAITEKYGIGKSQAYNIVTGKRWIEEQDRAS
jgi:hypothetical protein